MAFVAAAPVAYATLAATVAAAGVAAYSAEKQAHYQRAVADNNAKIASANATLALQKGQTEEQAKRTATAQMISKERAMVGAAGVDVNTGSPLKVQSDTAELGELDALTIRSNAARSAWNARNQQMGFESEGAQASSAGNLEAFSSLLGGASSFASKWQGYRSTGTPGF